jgi:erythromycin esterase-like protein
MQNTTIDSLIEASAYPFTGTKADYDPLLKLVGNTRLVLLGEASHGTHEFYRARAEITKRLIAEKGFAAVAVEADWPDAYRINRYVRADSDDVEAIDALGDFKRFPAWMWRNADVLDFVGWLRDHNDSLASDAVKIGFYGLDLYSLHRSIKAVLDYRTRWIRKRQAVHVTAIRASSILAKTRRPTAMRQVSASPNRVRTK